MLSFLRSHARDLGIDAAQVAIWACSGNAQTALIVLTDKTLQRPGIPRCGVLYYPIVS